MTMHKKGGDTMMQSLSFNYVMYSQLEKERKFMTFNEIYLFLHKLSFEYPKFTEWYNNLFSMDYELKEEREIIISQYDAQLAGIIILKKTKTENKICTLRVEKKYRNNGIARELIKKGIEWLEDEKPFVTCHSSKNRQYIGLFQYFGFQLSEKKFGYYGLFNLEYSYNGILPEKNTLLNKITLLDMEYILKYAIKNHITNWNIILDMYITLWCRQETQQMRTIST